MEITHTPKRVEGMEPPKIMVAKRNLQSAAPDFQVSMLVNFRGCKLDKLPFNHEYSMNVGVVLFEDNFFGTK